MASDSIPRPDAPDDAAPRASWVPLIVIVMAQILMVFNVSTLQVSIEGISSSLGVPATSIGTAIVTYALCVAGLILLGARIVQIFGSRRVFRATVAVFAAAMALMAASFNMATVIAAQVVAGTAAAALVPTLVVLLAENYRGAQQARALGWLGGAAAMGIVLAFLVAGVLGAWFGWRFTFGMLVLFGGGILYLSQRFGESPTKTGVQIDALGIVLAAGAVFLVSMGANNSMRGTLAANSRLVDLGVSVPASSRLPPSRRILPRSSSSRRSDQLPRNRACKGRPRSLPCSSPAASTPGDGFPPTVTSTWPSTRPARRGSSREGSRPCAAMRKRPFRPAKVRFPLAVMRPPSVPAAALTSSAPPPRRAWAVTDSISGSASDSSSASSFTSVGTAPGTTTSRPRRLCSSPIGEPRHASRFHRMAAYHGSAAASTTSVESVSRGTDPSGSPGPAFHRPASASSEPRTASDVIVSSPRPAIATAPARSFRLPSASRGPSSAATPLVSRIGEPGPLMM